MKRSSEPELPSELRAELARSRRAGHEYDALAKLPQLRAALHAAAPAGDGSPAEPGSAPDAGQQTRFRLQPKLAPTAWKLVLLAAIGAGVVAAWPAHQRAVQPAPSVQRVEPAAPAAPAAHQPEPAPRESEPSAKALPTNATVAQPATGSSPSARSSRREIAQLVRIRALLERDPAAAYRLADQSEREFPRGVLSEERQALQVLALAKSGSTEAAERKARAFFARYPQSPMRERLEAALRR